MSNLLSGALLVLALTAPWQAGAQGRLLDRSGRPLSGRITQQLAARGFAGTTTLDGAIQGIADRALDDGLTRARSEGLFPTGGAVVVLGLRERSLLAIASAPEPQRLRALESLPAGSVVKPFVALAAIGEGLDPSDRRPCPARFSAGGSTIRNWTGRDGPSMTIAQAIAQSCNTIFASLASRLWDAGEGGRAAIPRTFAGVGFGVPTGLVRGEQPGRVPPRAPTVGDLMVLAIGQGPLSVTPLQVASAFSRIAGDAGDGWTGMTGSAVPRLGRGALPPGAHEVRRGMELAVRRGTAHASFEDLDLERLPVAGKTGSAEIGDATPYAWFAAYAPANAPRYVVVVVIERGRAGALSAAPVARTVLDGILDLPRERPSFPWPHPAALLLAIPLLGALASPAAASLGGFAAGLAAGAIAGGSLAANALAFAIAGWIASPGRVLGPWMLAPAAGIGTLALPAAGQPWWWIASRAVLAALAVAAAAKGISFTRAKMNKAPRGPAETRSNISTRKTSS